MKTVILSEIMALLAAGAVSLPGQDATNAPAGQPASQTAASPTVALTTNLPPPGVTNDAPAPATSLAPDAPAGDGEHSLRFNFRGAPLESVLNYMSEAAGFIIILETKIEGKVDAWSQQPLTKDEAVDLLNTILHRKNYAAIRTGRTLKIVSREDAKKYDIPVKKSTEPEEIPKNDEMVTQILPVRYANATQMVKDLQPLLDVTYANMTANESANSLVLTATQTDIHRMAEIIKALDTSISAISTIKVFTLEYADAKELASAIKDLFPTQNSSSSSGRNAGGGNPMAMFGRGMMGGQQGGNNSSGQSEARAAASKVNAVADERTNSLIVSAPEEIMTLIEQIVKEIDTQATNITDLRVFHLNYADPVEMAALLTDVFPDETKSSDNTRSTMQFGGGRFGMASGSSSSTATSTRQKQQGKVTAVADQRTCSLVVSAARDLMPHIEQMVKELDSNPAKKQKVLVFQLGNADADSVKTILQGMFTSSSSQNNNNSTVNALNTRQEQNAQSSSTTSTTGLSSSSSSR
jgi:type II secretory pathway component GspD/PulD (secretin)